MDKVSLNLNVFDGSGNMTGETQTVLLPWHAVEAIIDHAIQISRMADANGTEEFQMVMDELAETLETYQVVASSTGSSPSRG